MGTGMPELGSKISLISKADIRYEGRLFTVDPQECTIALASVRSFGTEDRETQYPVPAQNQVYDYILFRGSDIKDIRVINNAPSLPNDPAIMQLSVPPSLGQQQFQSQGFSHPVLGPMGPQMGQFGSGYSGMGIIGAMAPGNLAPGMNRDFRGMQTAAASAGKPTSVLDLIGGGSRSTTPASLSSRKSPTADQSVQTGSAKKDDKKTVKPIQPPTHRNQQRPRKDSRGETSSHQDHHHQQQQQYHQRPQNRAVPLQNRGPSHNQGHRQQQQQPQQGWGGQMQQQPRGSMQQRPRGRPRGGTQNNYHRNVQSNHQQQQQQQQQQQGGIGGTAKPKSTLKFENDYDFEQANTQFEELKSQLEKLKIKDVVNGDTEKKDDSGNETGAGEGEQEDDSHTVYYNKAVSFFDNISCEAVERSKGRSQRTDWRAERKLNSETFGVASTRRNNNYFRGRGGGGGVGGGYYNRGFRGSYRGGYRNPMGQRKQQPQHLQNQDNNGASSRTSVTSAPAPSSSSSSNLAQNKPQTQQLQQSSQQSQPQQQSVIKSEVSNESGNQTSAPPAPVPAAAGN